MDDVNALLRPTWGAEKWILEGWNALNTREQEEVKNRMDELFSDGLPFVIEHDKMLYVHAFAVLAQLEVLAIQVPLKFEARMPTEDFRKRMRVQLVDEVFHGMVFTRILYELIAPYATPPAYDAKLEILCNFIRNESCPKVAVVLLNLVAEAWIEEVFCTFYEANIAPAVFSIILEDEHRHVREADLYREIGLPSSKELKAKLCTLEEMLLSNFLFKYAYMNAMLELVGADRLEKFLDTLDKKHKAQLQKVGLTPSASWHFWMGSRTFFASFLKQYTEKNERIELSPMRQLLMTQWKAPTDPSMVGEFHLDVGRVKFFEKKFPKETITMLMLQALSQGVINNPVFGRYLSFQKLYQSRAAYVALVVKLPECGDHLGAIIFENCHELSMSNLVARVQQNLKMMVYCYQRRLALEKKYPKLRYMMEQVMRDIAHGVYPYPMAGNPAISLSNIGKSGLSRAKSPLRVNEAVKFTLLAVEKRPVWNDVTQAFEPQDSLPVSFSADHRIFNGDVPIPHYVETAFNQVFDNMCKQPAKADTGGKKENDRWVMGMFESLIKAQPEVAYKVLVSMQTVWPDFIDFTAWIKTYMQTASAMAEA